MNIIKSTSTTRCRRTKRLRCKANRTRHFLVVQAETDQIFQFPFFLRSQRGTLLQPSREKKTPSQEVVSQSNFWSHRRVEVGGLFSGIFFLSSSVGPSVDLLHIWHEMPLVLLLVPLHLSIYMRRACKKRRRRLGIECARVEGQTVVSIVIAGR